MSAQSTRRRRNSEGVAGFVAAAALALCAGSSATGAGGEACMDCVQCSCVSSPRWVLRDADGTSIRALVEPRCGQYSSTIEAYDRCPPLEFGSPDQVACARVIDIDGKFINLNYDLRSGRFEPCMMPANTDPDRPLREIAAFMNDECTGSPILIASPSFFVEPEFQHVQSLSWAAGDIWYISGEDCPGHVPAYIDTGIGCGQTVDAFRCFLRPVPDWVRDLLPNPPYTLTLEYN